MARPKILILLAAYNGDRWIHDQVNSILRQIDVDVALVAGDDGSADGTRQALESYRADPRVSMAAPEPPSGSAARNFFRLIRSTSAEGFDFVALADQDDVWNETKLARACAVLNETGSDGYSCAVTAFWENGREVILEQASRRSESDFLFEGAGQGCTYVMTERLYSRVRTFLVDHKELTVALHYHDWTIYALARSWRADWAFDRQSMVRYRQHARNDTGARSSLHGIARRLRLMRTGWYEGQITAISRLCHAAAPADVTISEWRELMSSAHDLRRKWRLLVLSLRGGRRRRLDNLVIFLAIVLGWL